MVSGALTTLSPRRGGVLFMFTAALILIAPSVAAAQGESRVQMFRYAVEARVRAKALNAETLAPKSFELGAAAYAKADILFVRHKSPDDIREQIRLASLNKSTTFLIDIKHTKRIYSWELQMRDQTSNVVRSIRGNGEPPPAR